MTRRIRLLACLGIGFAAVWAAMGRVGADTTLTARVAASAANPLALQCSAASAPSETGTPYYYLVLRANYQNPSRHAIVPVVIRFTFYASTNQQGAVLASRTVIDSTGLQPGYGNSGQWQSIGYPQTARSMKCQNTVGNGR